MSEIFEQLAQDYEALAQELEQALAHCHTAARHARNQEIPRVCAHAFAAEGHMHNAQQQLKNLAQLHAQKARPD